MRVCALRAATVLALSAGCVTVSAAADGPYSDHRLVRVVPDSASERLAVAQLPMTLMSEAVARDGATDYLATDDEIALLRHVGVDVEVLVEDMQARVDAERARLDARAVWGVDPQPRGSDVFFEEFRDYAELNTFYDDLVANNPGVISRQTIGQSIQGRDIEAFTIGGAGDTDSRPSLIFNGTAHAREWISPMTVTYIMRELVEGYGNDPRITALLDSVTFRIAPIMNPDGYLYTWSNERFWRKNRRNNGNGTWGVDWNRNFDANWSAPGASGDPSDDTYYGTAPFSEPETQAIRDFILGVPNAALHIDYHAFSQLILWPWGNTSSPLPQPDRGIHESLGTAYADTIQSVSGEVYQPIQSFDLYQTSGTSSDWAYGSAGVVALALELRPSSGGTDGFDPSPTLILPCAEENFAAVLGLGESVAVGVTSSFPGGQPTLVEPDTATAVSIEIFPAFSGPLDASSATLYSRVGDSGPFSGSSMSASGDVYTGSLPAAPCGEVIQYYVQIDSTGGATYAVPFGAPANAFEAQAIETAVAFDDDIEADTGWTVGAPGDDATTGIWERANPQSTDAQPENDHTPGGTICWVTDGDAGGSLGANDIDGGTTTLISPAFDATGGDSAIVSFWVWYSNNTGAAPNQDSMPVRISNDNGASWQLLDTIDQSTSGWELREYDLAGVIEPTDAVRLRFEASDLGDGSIVEAAVDDLRVVTAGCPDTGNIADLAPPFGVLDLADIQAFVDGFLNQDPIADLAAPFGVLDLADVQAFTQAFLNGIP